MKSTKLDNYEQKLEKDFDKLQSLSPSEMKEMSNILKSAAVNYQKKGRRITIRVYETDLEKIKKMAMNEGLPYQTFITSTLHKLSAGYLKDCRNHC